VRARRARRVAIAGAGLAVAATAVLATGATGVPPEATDTRTYTVDLARAVGNDIDAPPKGPSLGDTFQSHAALLGPGGSRAGSVHLSGVGTTRSGGILTGVLHVAGGDLVFQNFTIDLDNATYAVVGGTGAFVGAHGTVTTRVPKGANAVTVTVTLG
jgi:hypothetical protein